MVIFSIGCSDLQCRNWSIGKLACESQKNAAMLYLNPKYKTFSNVCYSHQNIEILP